MDHAGSYLYRDETERVMEWVCRQGIVAKKGTTVDPDMSDDDRTDLLRELVLDFGRGMFKMAVDYSRTNPHFALSAMRKRLLSDARGAFGVTAKQWLDKVEFVAGPLISDLVFVSSPRPQLEFSFS